MFELMDKKMMTNFAEKVCGHLLGKGSRLWCLLWVCHFPIGILGQVWYLIVSIPDLCTLTYFAWLDIWSYILNCLCLEYLTNIFKSKFTVFILQPELMMFIFHKTTLLPDIIWLMFFPESVVKRCPVNPLPVVQVSWSLSPANPIMFIWKDNHS